MLYPVISSMMNSGKAQVVITDYSDTIADNSNNTISFFNCSKIEFEI